MPHIVKFHLEERGFIQESFKKLMDNEIRRSVRRQASDLAVEMLVGVPAFHAGVPGVLAWL